MSTFAVMEVFWYAVYAVYAAGGHSLAGYLARPGLRKVFDRVVGTIFIGFGLALLRARP